MASDPIPATESAPAPPAKKTVVFCLPGNSFSNRFLISWTQTLHDLWESGKYNVLVSNQYSSCVHFSRAKCLGAAVTRGPRQVPFGGQVPYDVLVWIDSDIVFTAKDVIVLIESALQHHPVVSGLYMMEDGQNFCAVENWDTAYYIQNGGCFEFLKPERVKAYTETAGTVYMPCAYAGLGFCAMRYGVMEDPRLNYPWFYTDKQVIQTGQADIPEYHDLASEDVSLFRNLTEKGVIPAVMVRCDLRVGHEKKVVL